MPGGRIGCFLFTAGRTTIRETGLTGLQLKFFRTDDTRLDRERHNSFIVMDAVLLL